MTKAIASKSPWTEQQVALITNTVAKGATPDELKLFLYTASRTGLDPLTRQIHFVKRGGQMTVQTGIDGYRAIAERSGTLAGIDDAVFDSEDGPRPNKASVTVYRLINGERVPFTASARWSEYAVEGGFMWKKMPYLMLAKCAEALALRKAFPNDLTGLYTNEEMQQADKASAPATTIADTETVEGEVTYEPVKEGNSDPQKKCPNCGKYHMGKYAKCLDCWKAERNGTPVTKTKTLVNEDAEPFPS